MAEMEIPPEGDTPLFPRPVEIERILQEDIQERITASSDEKLALARFLEVERLDLLEADLTLVPWRQKGVKLTGRLRAVAEQTCVVTLEPITCRYEEEFSRTFLPAERLAKQPRLEDIVDAEGDDPPDPITGGVIDVGAVVLEELALAIDPYPRKDGAEIDSRYRVEPDAVDEARPNPFAQLSVLKKDGGEGAG